MTSVKIPAGKNCGFVTFLNRPSADAALAALHGAEFGSSRIRLAWGRSASANAQQQQQQQQLQQRMMPMGGMHPGYAMAGGGAAGGFLGGQPAYYPAYGGYAPMMMVPQGYGMAGSLPGSAGPLLMTPAAGVGAGGGSAAAAAAAASTPDGRNIQYMLQHPMPPMGYFYAPPPGVGPTNHLTPMLVPQPQQGPPQA